MLAAVLVFLSHREGVNVDDEVSLAEMLGQMLAPLGHEAVLCHSPLKALQLIEEQQFDVILSDYRMPGLDGQQFYRMVKQSKPALAQRMVFLTGDTAHEETSRFLKSTGLPYLTKPFQLMEVQLAIGQVLIANSTGMPTVRASNA